LKSTAEDSSAAAGRGSEGRRGGPSPKDTSLGLTRCTRMERSPSLKLDSDDRILIRRHPTTGCSLGFVLHPFGLEVNVCTLVSPINCNRAVIISCLVSYTIQAAPKNKISPAKRAKRSFLLIDQPPSGRKLPFVEETQPYYSAAIPSG